MYTNAGEYSGPTWWPVTLLKDIGQGGMRRIAAAWVAASLIGILLAVLEARLDWSGLVVNVGGFTVGLTVYPPLLISLLLAIWLGPMWGAIPGYIAGLASGLIAGMSLPLALVFAFATPVEVAIVWGTMVLLQIHPDLPRLRDLLRFVAIAMVASAASSLAGLIWIEVRQLDLLSGQRIWQGWVLGDFIAMAVVAALALRLFGRRMRGWVDEQVPAPPRLNISYTRSTALVVGMITLLALMVARGVGLMLGALESHPLWASAEAQEVMGRLREVLVFMGLLLLVGVGLALAFATALARLGERDRSKAQRDALTGCLNRRAFAAVYRRESDRSRRVARPVSLLFFDIDRFKTLNDRHGHEVGDEALQLLARRVDTALREHDVLFRWGGEEFVVLLPHTGAPEAARVAERIRLAVAEDPLEHPQMPDALNLTVSIGTATADPAPPLADDLLHRADAACYRAKGLGRNRVETARAELVVVPA